MLDLKEYVKQVACPKRPYSSAVCRVQSPGIVEVGIVWLECVWGHAHSTWTTKNSLMPTLMDISEFCNLVGFETNLNRNNRLWSAIGMR